MDSPALKQLQQQITGGVQVRAGASVEARLGKYLDDQTRRHRDLWQSVHSVPIKGSALTGVANGVLDFPTMLGPSEGLWWDVRRVSCWGFTAGSVSLYLNDPTGAGELLGVFTSAGQLTYGGNLFLGPNDRLVLIASGITGSVFVGGSAIEVAASWWPEYLI